MCKFILNTIIRWKFKKNFHRVIEINDSSNEGEASTSRQSKSYNFDDEDLSISLQKEFEKDFENEFSRMVEPFNPQHQQQGGVVDQDNGILSESSDEEFNRLSNNKEFSSEVDKFFKIYERLNVKQSPSQLIKNVAKKRALVDDVESPSRSPDILKISSKVPNHQMEHVRIISNELLEVNQKFKLQRKRKRFHFQQFNHSKYSFEEFIDRSFQEIYNSIMSDVNPLKRYDIGITIRTFDDSNSSSYDAGLNVRDIRTITPEMISDLLTTVSQSNQSFQITGLLEVETLLIEMPTGGSPLDIKKLTDSEILKHKTSLIEYPRDDNNLCLVKAIWTGRLYCINTSDVADAVVRGYMRRNSNLNQDIIQFMASINLHATGIGMGVTELMHCQLKMPYYSFTVYSSKNDLNAFLYNSVERREKHINIFYFEQGKHFVYIKNLLGFFNKRYQCEKCFVLYDTDHDCSLICKYCKSCPKCPSVVDLVTCSDCLLTFKGNVCLQKHKINLPIANSLLNICDLVKICRSCGEYYNKIKKPSQRHMCNTRFCSNCSQQVSMDRHTCYIKKYTKNTPKQFTIIFYDIESSLDASQEDAQTTVHTPNMLCATQVCEKCIYIYDRYNCTVCLERSYAFSGTDCVKSFIDWCVKHQPNRPPKKICVSHNGSSYDSHLVLNYLLSTDKPVKMLRNGRKILSMEYNNQLVFKDSLLFIPQPLSKFPITFGFANEAKLPYPIFFNTRENFNYVGRLPAKKFFMLSNMKDSELEDFNKWYDQKIDSNYVWNNLEELKTYCSQDVYLLFRGVSCFIREFENLTNVNPIVQAITLAMTCMYSFRRNHLQPETLIITPRNYYGRNGVGSKAQSLFIAFHRELLKSKAISTINDTEKSIVQRKLKIKALEKINFITEEYPVPNTPYIADGVSNTGDTLYEFFGCYFHMHNCLLKFTFNADLQSYSPMVQSLLKRRVATDCKLNRYIANGYSVTSAYECEFKEQLKEYPDIENLIKSIPIKRSLNLRDALYGGRVECFQIYAKSGETKINYRDIISLYPHMNRVASYPIGSPVIKKGAQCNNIKLADASDGIAFCRMLPPQDLFLPVLPSKINNKLVFCLCYTCAKNGTNQSQPAYKNIDADYKCLHNPAERSLIGTWDIQELKLAIRFGYQQLAIYELWSFNALSGQIFSSYHNLFIKAKMEASGFPKVDMTDIEKEEYVNQVFAAEGVRLDISKIEENPSKRAIAKLSMNNLWGKFSQNVNRLNHQEIVSSVDELYKFLKSPGIEVCNVQHAGPEKLWIDYKFMNVDLESPMPHENVIIGIKTTAAARCYLYEEMAKLREKLIYVVIF